MHVRNDPDFEKKPPWVIILLARSQLRTSEAFRRGIDRLAPRNILYKQAAKVAACANASTLKMILEIRQEWGRKGWRHYRPKASYSWFVPA